MKSQLLLLLCFVVAASFIIEIATVSAQSVNPVCGSEAAWQQAIKIDPTFVQRRQQMETMIEQYIQAHKAARTTGAANDSIYNIPLVFHIIQEGGTENISDDQVRNCVQLMNLDYRRQNADTIYTLLPFLPVAADTKIQFQLATIDPNGNCTNGITRSFSHRTENFDDYSKSIIDWPSDKYLNIWVVKSIGLSVPNGEVIGYAQFPVTGLSETDGVVLAYNYVGVIDQAVDNTDPCNAYAGRDATHEVGHFFNLIHPWGNARCGDDQVDDTPIEYGPNFNCPCGPCTSCGGPAACTPGFSCDPADSGLHCVNGVPCQQGNNYYLFDDSCGSPNPPGVMYQNYMDYTLGKCKNLFTVGQSERMHAAIEVSRFSLWQPSNLAATGTDSASISVFNSNSVNPPCTPHADFLPLHQNICPGGSVRYTANTTNGTPTSWNWSFPGGTPSVSTIANPPLIAYSNPGSYPVTLIVSNEQGSDTITKTYVAIVDSGMATVPFFEGFEDTLPTNWISFNDDGGNGWQRTSLAAYAGNYSMSVQNYETIGNTAPGSIKELLTPSFDLTHITQPVLFFYLSYGQQFSGNEDSLSIGASTQCGASSSWTELKRLTEYNLAAGSGGFQPDNFVPNPAQWALVSIPLTSYSGDNNVKFHFYFKSDLLSNNIYIDNINIGSAVGINEEQNPAFNFDAMPNPASQSFTISYLLKNSEDVVINLYDLQGRLIRQMEEGHRASGAHEFRVDGSTFNLASGMYILKMITPDGLVSKKLIYSNE